MQKSVSLLTAVLWGATAASLPAAAAEPALSPPEVNLLQTVPTVLAVSSIVKGTSDKPDFLVDGDLETAWNSQSGDLHGWIAVRIPRTAQVTAIKLTAGYPKVKAKGDLFVMNHRLRKVRVLRDNKPVGEYTLDPEQRALQTLPVRVPGGDLRIEVLETVPGTKPSWRELCISELQVMGTPPPPVAAPPTSAAAAGTPALLRPVVRVGSLDPGTRKGPLALTELSGPFESPESFAKAQSGALREPKLQIPIPAIPSGSGPFMAVRIVVVGTQCRLAVQSSRGWFFSDSLAACPEPAPELPFRKPSTPPDLGAPPASDSAAPVSRPWELYAVSRLELADGVVGQSPVLLAEIQREIPVTSLQDRGGPCEASLYVCGIGSSGRPSCTSPLPMGDGFGSYCSKIDGESEWSWRYHAAFSSSGRLEVSLDESASLGPTECEGRRSECARAEKDKRRQVRANVPDEAKALARAGVVVFL